MFKQKPKIEMRVSSSQSATMMCLFLILMLLVTDRAVASTHLGSNLLKIVGVTSIPLIYITNPMKADRVIAEMGNGEGVSIFRLGAEWDLQKDVLQFYDFTLDTFLQFDMARWQSTKQLKPEGENTSMGITPVFRFTSPANGAMIYIDTSIGIGVISNTKINDSEFSSSLQFFGSLGFGAFFGSQRQWGIGYKFNHMLNSGIEHPNNGIDFHMVSLSYQYH